MHESGFDINRQRSLKAQSSSLPNGIDLKLLGELLAYSGKYQITIQFWPKQTAVFIEKNFVELKSYGGDFDFVVRSAIAYLQAIQPKLKSTNGSQ